MCCDGYIESLVCEVDRSQTKTYVCVVPLFGRAPVAGVGHLPANTIISISLSKTPLQSLVVRSSPVYQSATNMASITFGRIYVQPMANIAVIDHTVKGPQKKTLMDRSWGFPTNVLLQGEDLLYPLYCGLGIAGDGRCMPD